MFANVVCWMPLVSVSLPLIDTRWAAARHLSCWVSPEKTAVTNKPQGRFPISRTVGIPEVVLRQARPYFDGSEILVPTPTAWNPGWLCGNVKVGQAGTLYSTYCLFSEMRCACVCVCACASVCAPGKLKQENQAFFGRNVSQVGLQGGTKYAVQL